MHALEDIVQDVGCWGSENQIIRKVSWLTDAQWILEKSLE